MVLKGLRRIAVGILPWVIGGAVIGGAIVFVASKQHHAAQEYEAAREKRCASSFPLDPEKQDTCKHERDSPNNYLPWGYILLAWPEGITAWAIILTFAVIGWQADQTRKATEATLISANAAKESAATAKGIAVPTLVLHEFSFIVQGIEDAAAFYRKPGVKLELKNYGQSPAFLRKYAVGLSWGEHPSQRFTPYPFEDVVIDAGKTYEFKASELDVLEAPPEKVIEDLVRGERYLVFSGWVSYGDVFGSPIRKLPLHRELTEYDPVRRRMTVMDTSPLSLRLWTDTSED